MPHYIYKIEFLCGEQGRYYIGKRTCDGNPYNDNCYRGSGLFCKGYFRKYGTDNTYKKTILEINPNKEENALREEFWIGDLWKTDSLCMNQCAGGLNGGRAKGTVDLRGEKNPFYGKHHTEESKRKMSEAKKRNRKTEVHKENNILFVKRKK